MAEEPDPLGSAAATPRQRGWFMRLPLWVRIAVPAVLAILLVGGAVAVISAVSQPTDPVEVARSLQSSVAFTEADGSGRRSQVRCTVRVEDGRMRVTGIRYGG